jgi:sugar lactone lactonase YvrE
MTSMEDEEGAHLFVTNVLNGTVAANGAVVNQGTVLRIDLAVSQTKMPQIRSITEIGSGFSERTDPAALVIGPTGVGLSPGCAEEEEDACVLYVADSVNNRIAAIFNPLQRKHSAGTGLTVSSGGSLNDPLGLSVAPNGHILVMNGDDGFITEITPRGKQVATVLLDNKGGPPPGNGTLFGVIFDRERGVIFVDDGSNTLNSLN